MRNLGLAMQPSTAELSRIVNSFADRYMMDDERVMGVAIGGWRERRFFLDVRHAVDMTPEALGLPAEYDGLPVVLSPGGPAQLLVQMSA